MGKGFLTYSTAVILQAVANGYLYGFDIIDITGVPGGTVYPALRRLEAKGWLKGRWGTSENNRRARFYELTPAGLKQLDSERQAWERFSAALGLILRTE